VKKIIALFLSIALVACGGGDVYASGVSSASNYNPSAVAITGGTITTSTINATTSQSLNGKRIMSATAPTIANGFGTGPSITNANGTAAFNLTIGTGGTDSNGIINFPPGAVNGWNCTGSLMAGVAPPAYQILRFFQSGISTVTIYSQNISTGAGTAVAFSAGQIFSIQCVAI